MKTLTQFYYEQLVDEGISVEDESQAKEWLLYDMNQIVNDENGHYGDCTKQNISCRLCLLQNLLDDYYEYVKEEMKKKR